MLEGYSHHTSIIDKYYLQKRQKIYKKDIWQGIPPSSQQHTINTTHKKININQHNDNYKYLQTILPCTLYPQSTPNINNSALICNNHLYPYSAIGIVIFQTEGITRYCTGSLIYKNIVITSSICCYNYQINVETSNVYFVIGCWECGGSSLQKIRVIGKFYKNIRQNEMKQGNMNGQGYIGKGINEIAILELEKCVQKQFGYFGILFKPQQQENKQEKQPQPQKNNQKIGQQKVYISGYAQINLGNKNIYQNSCLIQQLYRKKQKDIISHKIYTSYGQTGSPIYVYDQQSCKWFIIGIHLGRQQQQQITQNPQININNYRQNGIRLTTQIRYQINQWVTKRRGQLDISYIHGNSNKSKGKGYNKQIQINQLKQIIDIDLPYLIGVILNYQNIGNIGLQQIMKNNWINLNWLQLRNCKLNNHSIKYLAKCKWPMLSRLCLSQNQLTSQGLKNLSKSDWPNLTVLSLSYNKIDNTACQKLQQSYWPQLSVISLSNNLIKCQDINIIQIFSKLSQNYPLLSWLQLYSNYYKNQYNVVESIKQMFRNIYVYI